MAVYSVFMENFPYFNVDDVVNIFVKNIIQKFKAQVLAVIQSWT